MATPTPSAPSLPPVCQGAVHQADAEDDQMTRTCPSILRHSRRFAALSLAAPLALQCSGSSMSQLKALVRASFPGVPQMSIEELDRRLADDPPPLVIDVREPFEYEVSHLPGAVHAQGEDIARLVAGTEPNRVVVLYCSVGYRSSAAVADLIQLNDPDLVGRVWNLEGSIFEWANSGRAVYRGREEADRVHPYGEQWSKLLTPHLRPQIGQPSRTPKGDRP